VTPGWPACIKNRIRTCWERNSATQTDLVTIRALLYEVNHCISTISTISALSQWLVRVTRRSVSSFAESSCNLADFADFYDLPRLSTDLKVRVRHDEVVIGRKQTATGNLGLG